MPENDIKKERALSGGAIDAQDQVEIEGVRSQLLEHVRVRKGLPADPQQLDIQAISQLTDVTVVDGNQSEDQETDSARIIDISTLTPNRSAMGVVVRAGRERSRKLRKAA